MAIDSILPFEHGAAILLVLLSGGFIKCFTTLQIFRLGIGLYGSTVGILVVVFSTALSFFVVNTIAPLESFFGDNGARVAVVQKAVRPFLESRTFATDRAQLNLLEQKLKKRYQSSPVIEDDASDEKADAAVEATVSSIPADSSFVSLLMAFLLRELKEAFQIGLLFIIPFVIIDLLVVHVMQLLQVTQLAATTFSLPLKLILFLAVDGWSLMTQRLVGEYLIT